MKRTSVKTILAVLTVISLTAICGGPSEDSSVFASVAFEICALAVFVLSGRALVRTLDNEPIEQEDQI